MKHTPNSRIRLRTVDGSPLPDSLSEVFPAWWDIEIKAVHPDWTDVLVHIETDGIWTYGVDDPDQRLGVEVFVQLETLDGVPMLQFPRWADVDAPMPRYLAHGDSIQVWVPKDE